MKKERDLSIELGRGNWLDVVAGESYFLGNIVNDPSLVARAIDLAGMIRDIPYNSDEFFRVIALGMDLQDRVVEVKSGLRNTIIMDEVAVRENGRKTLHDWEYNLVMVGGRYQINMIMPEYFGDKPESKNTDTVCEMAKASFDNFDEFKVRRVQEKIKFQLIETVEITDKDNQVCYKEVDFFHECGYKKGQVRTFYFDNYAQAMEVWNEARIILDQKP